MSLVDMPSVPGRGNDVPPPDAPPPRRRRLRRVLAWTAAGLLALLVALAAAGVLALRSEAGTRHLWVLATRLSAGMLSGKYEGGTLLQGLRLRDVVFASGATRVTVDRIDSSWNMAWSPRRWHVSWLRVGKVDVQLGPSAPSTTPAKMPTSLELPLAIDIDVLTLERLALRTSPAATAQPMIFSALAGALHSDGQRHRLSVDRLETPYGQLAANAQIAAQAPFPLKVQAFPDSSWQKGDFSNSARPPGFPGAVGARV